MSKVFQSCFYPKKNNSEMKISIDFDAIRKRNNEILKTADYYLSEELNFTGECDEIILNQNEEQLFDPEKNRLLMMTQMRRSIQQHLKNSQKHIDASTSQDSESQLDDKRTTILSIWKDRMNVKYFDDIESTSMDNSSIICSLCQQFIFARDFYKHVDDKHHEYFYKLQTMSRQIFRNTPPIELNFGKQSEFDVQTHSIGQIDHLAIYYSRSEHISTNSLLLHDIRPNESRRRLCLVYRMNEFLESLKEKEKARKKQAQLKEDKKLLTQENKKRKKQGEPILLELPNKKKQFTTKHYFHQHGRSGKINLTLVQALALKNRDFLHQNKNYHPQVRSLKSIETKPIVHDRYSKDFETFKYKTDSKNNEPNYTPKSNKKIIYKKFKLLNYLNEHNSRTVFNKTAQTSFLNNANINILNDKNDKYKKSNDDKDYPDTNIEYELKSFITKCELEEALLNNRINNNQSEYLFIKDMQQDKNLFVSPAVQLINSCSHVQNRHLRRPKGEYIPKKLYKTKASEPYFGYDSWICRKDIFLQRINWTLAAIGKYFPRFKSNEIFMKYLFDIVKKSPSKSISRCVKIAILEAIADRKFFLDSSVLKDIGKMSKLQKIFAKLARSEQKYEKYSKNGQRFTDYLDYRFEDDENLNKSFSFNQPEIDNDQLFDDNEVFSNLDTLNLIPSLPYPIVDKHSQPEMIDFDEINDKILEESNEIFEFYDHESNQIGPQVQDDPLFDDSFLFNNQSRLSINVSKFIFKRLFQTLFENFEKNLNFLSISKIPLIFREFSSIGQNLTTKVSIIHYSSLETRLVYRLCLKFQKLENQDFTNKLIGSSEISENAEIHHLPNLCTSNEDFFLSHKNYIDQILSLFNLQKEKGHLVDHQIYDESIHSPSSDHDYFNEHPTALSSLDFTESSLKASDFNVSIQMLNKDSTTEKKATKNERITNFADQDLLNETQTGKCKNLLKNVEITQTKRSTRRNSNELSSSGSKASVFLSPSFNNSNIKMAKSGAIIENTSTCKRVYIVKKRNHVTNILPISSNQIKPETTLLIPSAVKQQQNQPVKEPKLRGNVVRKLNKTDYDVPLTKIFKESDKPNSSISIHKYFTRSSALSRKRPSHYEPDLSLHDLSANKSKANVNNVDGKRNPISRSPIVESGPIPAIDSSYCSRQVDDTISVSKFSSYNHHNHENKSPLREISLGDVTYRKKAITNSIKTKSIDSEEIEQSSRKDNQSPDEFMNDESGNKYKPEIVKG